jgi:hypothetical protein
VVKPQTRKALSLQACTLETNYSIYTSVPLSSGLSGPKFNDSHFKMNYIVFFFQKYFSFQPYSKSFLTVIGKGKLVQRD